MSALPDKLSAPARRALDAAGLTSLEKVAAAPRREVAQLHGIGSNALKQLEAAIDASGLGPWTERPRAQS